jgi:hypothetical protein
MSGQTDANDPLADIDRQPRQYCNVDHLAHSKPIFWLAFCDDREMRIDIYLDDFDSEYLLESLFPKSRGW